MKYVKVKQGMIEGLQQHGYCVFKGIPFAKPPIGNLRWKAPHPADAWEGVYYADHFKYRGRRTIHREKCRFGKKNC